MTDILDKAVINKISKSKYDYLVQEGTISPQMIREEAWLFTDDQFVSSSDKQNWNSKASISDIPTATSELTNDSGFITSASLPTKTSDLTNDSGFITSSDIPTNVSSFTNDAGYITSAAIPTNVSAFTNDAGYLTSETDPTVPAWAKQPNPPTYTKADVGLGNVDNKSSATIRSEITSGNVTTALGYTPVDSNLIGANNGIAELDSTGKVPSSQLPSYVDDVIEGYFYNNKFWKDSAHTIEIPAEADKIYVDVSTDITYRWSGSAYVAIGSSLTLGTTHSTAYYGDLGEIAYNHSQAPHAPANAEANIIDSISVNNTALTPDADKNVNITVPTATSDLNNDSGFITSSDIPTNVSSFTNDAGYITQETDPIFTASPAATITSNNIADWTNKADTSDIKDGTLTIQKNGTTVTTFTANQSSNVTANITVPTAVSDLTNDEHFITSDNDSIKNIIEITYADYQQLVTDDDVDPDTEYHIIDGQSSLGDMETFINYLILEADKRKHPIGSLEFNTSGTNPADYLGFGTWIAWGSGQVPVGVDTTQTEFDTVEKTGGSKTSSTTYTPAGTNTGTAITLNAVSLSHSGGAVSAHTLTVNEMPSHGHSFPAKAGDTGGGISGWTPDAGATYVSNKTGYSLTNTGGGQGHSHGFTQPSSHSFTPTTKTVTNPTFSGTQATITESTVQPYITCYMFKRTA